MRTLAILLMLAAAGPAAAQSYLPLQQARDAEAFAAAQAARARDIALNNELAATQARLQTEQALGALAAAQLRPSPFPSPAPASAIQPAPAASPRTSVPAPMIEATKPISIPDAALAQSNARVLAAANNRR